MHLYIFGSICRGEIDESSDIDLLAIVDNLQSQEKFDKEKFSTYTVDRLKELWNEGNPFAWHLFIESKLVFSKDNTDIIREWGEPKDYKNPEKDLKKFYDLFKKSIESIKHSNRSEIFDLSMIFLSIRNFASCYALGFLSDFNFSRNSALKLKRNKLEIDRDCFKILERARILSTRGSGTLITKNESEKTMKELVNIDNWFQTILKDI